ncbi:MAG TPA: DUF86 domain-containing protein [Acidobacteriota bacterium]
MVDAVRLRALLSRLRGHVADLQPYAAMETTAYLADPRAIHASKYLLVIAIEDALATANHVIASEGLRAPADYADAFRSLKDAGTIDAELSERLEGMARFRNLLVHVYAEVDDRRVHEFLGKDVGDLEKIAAALLNAFPELGEESS